MDKNEIRAGQYYAAKYQGDNGDLILGKVKSVRRNGEVLCINMLNKETSIKSTEILLRRNVRVSKKLVVEALNLYQSSQDKQAVRDFLVEAYKEYKSLVLYANSLKQYPRATKPKPFVVEAPTEVGLAAMKLKKSTIKPVQIASALVDLKLVKKLVDELQVAIQRLITQIESYEN